MKAKTRFTMDDNPVKFPKLQTKNIQIKNKILRTKIFSGKIFYHFNRNGQNIKQKHSF